MTEFTSKYNPNERVAKCQDDDSFEISRIEVEFAIPVVMTQDQYMRILEVINEITHAPWNTPLEGVHWMSTQGSKPNWSQADAAFLGKVPDINAPENGEPTFDDSVTVIGTSARSFLSEKERTETLINRTIAINLNIPSSNNDE